MKALIILIALFSFSLDSEIDTIDYQVETATVTQNADVDSQIATSGPPKGVILIISSGNGSLLSDDGNTYSFSTTFRYGVDDYVVHSEPEMNKVAILGYAE